mgnify:FL=1
MKRTIHAMMAAALLCSACAVAGGATLEVESEAELSVVSAYVWRGRVMNDEPCFQPSLRIASSNILFSAWGTWDLTDVTNSSSHSRVDLTVEASGGFGIHMFSAGLAAYIYHDAPASAQDDTFEVYLRYVADVLMLPFVEVRYDFSAYDGYYGSAGIAHSFTLRSRSDELAGVDLDMKLSVGACDRTYADRFYGLPADDLRPEFKPDKPILADLTASVWLPMTLSDNLSVIPMARFVYIIDGDVRDAWSERGLETETWLWGVSLGVSF